MIIKDLDEFIGIPILIEEKPVVITKCRLYEKYEMVNEIVKDFCVRVSFNPDHIIGMFKCGLTMHKESILLQFKNRCRMLGYSVEAIEAIQGWTIDAMTTAFHCDVSDLFVNETDVYYRWAKGNYAIL